MNEEVLFWVLVGLMILTVVLHVRMYVSMVWQWVGEDTVKNNDLEGVQIAVVCTEEQTDEAVEKDATKDAATSPNLCGRAIKCCVLLIFPGSLLWFFLYGFPLMIFISSIQYCGGKKSQLPNLPENDFGCESEEEAGLKPFLFIFGPTIFMWVADSVATNMYVFRTAPKPAEGEYQVGPWLGEFPRVMFPRFGMTLLYAAFILYAKAMLIKIKLEDDNEFGDDTEALNSSSREDYENYAKNCKIIGHTSLAVGLFFILYGFSHPFIKNNSQKGKPRDEELSAEVDDVEDIKLQDDQTNSAGLKDDYSMRETLAMETIQEGRVEETM